MKAMEFQSDVGAINKGLDYTIKIRGWLSSIL